MTASVSLHASALHLWKNLAFILVVCLCGWLSEEVHAAAAADRTSFDEPAQCAAAANICTNNSIHRDGKTTHLCIKVAVVGGRLKVDRNNTCFYARPKFVERLRASKLTIEVVKKSLLDRVDAAFDTKERLFNYALTPPTERETVGKISCPEINDEKARRLCAFTGSWKEFTDLAATWRPGNSLVLPDALLALAGADALGEVGEDSPLELRRPEDNVAVDGTTGLFLVSVADPIANWNDTAEYKICIGNKCEGRKSDDPRTVAAPNDIRKALTPLVGRLWDKSEIVGVIQEYYAGKGLLATVKVGSPFADIKEITIKESPRILSIGFTQDLKPEDIDKALYLLLPDRLFRRYTKCREDLIAPNPDPLKQTIIEVKSLMSEGTCEDSEESEADLPYLNILKLQLQKLQLNTVNLDVSVGSTTVDEEDYVFFQVFKAKDAEEEDKKKGENDQAAAISNEEGRVDPNLSRPETQNSFVPRVTVEPSPTPTATPTPSPSASPTSSPSASPTPAPVDGGAEGKKKKEKRNYLGGGFEYRSGEGVRVFGIYQRSKLLTDTDGISLKFGGHDEPLGSVNYYADYLAFKHLGHRRLTLQLTGSTDLRAQRIFGGQETDERRTGGLARGELELFRDRGGNLLRLSLEAQRMTVELSRDDETLGKQNLTTLDFGALYLLQPDYELDYPRWARVEPRVRFGLGLAQGEPRFNAFFTSGNFHQKLPGFFEVDISGRLGLASGDTPVFEQPTLGGAESLRGFRQDEAVGRRMWSLQNELWMPVPGTTNSAAPFRRFLLRSVRLAAFADVGGVSQTSGSQPGVRFGPGAGLRFIFNPIVIKADWAYGLTAPTATTGRGRFYFSIASNLPF